jgi:sporulation integral membrane protein YtvI
MIMSELLGKIDKLILFCVLYTISFFVFFSTLSYTLPFVLALICALIIRKPTEFISKKLNIKMPLSALLTTIIFFTIIILILALGVTTITQEAIQLGKNAQFYLSQNSFNVIYDYFGRFKKYYNNLDPYVVSALEKNLSNFINNVSNLTVNFTGKLVSSILGILTSIPYILMVILFTLLTTYFFTRDITSNGNKIFSFFSESKTDKLLYVYKEARRMLVTYLLSYMFILGVTFIETLIVFLIFKVRYALILSIICAMADVLPIIGIGAIYIPLAVIYFFFVKSYIISCGIIISYIIISIIRQIIEPKIVSSSLGIHPVAVLAALFIGLKANGFSGIIFCIFLVVFYNIFKRVNIM